MMRLVPSHHTGFTLVEVMVSAALIGALGLIVFSLLNVGIILGTKNTATNTAHQQARMALLQMTRTLNSAVNPPSGGAPAISLGYPSPTPNPTPPPSQFSVCSFQLPAGDSLNPIRLSQVTAATAGSNQITVDLNANPSPVIQTGAQAPHLIIPGYDFEAVISQVTGSGTVTLTLDKNVPDELAAIDLTSSNVSCFTTDVCSYEINNGSLVFHRPQGSNLGTIVARGITSLYPFQPSSGNSSVVINLTTADTKGASGGAGSDQYLASHGAKSMNDALSQTVSIKDQRTTDVQSQTP